MSPTSPLRTRMTATAALILLATMGAVGSATALAKPTEADAFELPGVDPPSSTQGQTADGCSHYYPSRGTYCSYEGRTYCSYSYDYWGRPTSRCYKKYSQY